MSRAAVQQLESLLNRSFDGENTQSLLANLTEVRADDWDWLPDGGERTIRTIFEHAAIAKHIYTDFLFGTARRTWREVRSSAMTKPNGDTAALVEWAREGHAAFMAGMMTLQDSDLSMMTAKWHGALDTKARSDRRHDPARLLPRRRDQPPPGRAPAPGCGVGVADSQPGTAVPHLLPSGDSQPGTAVPHLPSGDSQPGTAVRIYERRLTAGDGCAPSTEPRLTQPGTAVPDLPSAAHSRGRLCPST